MNWSLVADVVRRAQCFERQRYRSGKGTKARNPCQVNEDTAQIADALDQGDTTKGTPEQVQDWLVKHTCHASRAGRCCQHKGCIDREGAIDFCQEARKAA